MAIETTVDASRDLTVHRCSGELSADEVVRALDTFYQQEALPERVLWDLTDVERLDLDQHDLRRLAVYPLKYRVVGTLKGGKRAILAGSDETFGMARIIDTYKELETDLSAYDTRTFRDRDEALRWLAS